MGKYYLRENKINNLKSMTELNQIYKCNVCGNMTEVIHTGEGEMICCGQPMERQIEKTEDVGYEKHVPVVEETEKGVRVKIGAVPHPMEEAHFIEWIEILADGKTCRKFLKPASSADKPGDAPEAEFNIAAAEISSVQGYCNIHGLWKK